MENLTQLLDRIVQLIGLGVDKTDKTDKTEEGVYETLFEELDDAPNTDSVDFYGEDTEDVNFNFQDAVYNQELRDLKDEVTTAIAHLYMEGSVSEELSDKIQEALSGNVTIDSIVELKDMIQAENGIEEAEDKSVLTNQKDIDEYLNSLWGTAREGILEKVGESSDISKITISSTGTVQIQTKDTSLVVFPSGKSVSVYDTEDATGFDTYDEESRITSSTYVDHKQGDVAVREDVSYNEDNSSIKTVRSTAKPDIEQTINSNANNEVTQIKERNIKTGEETITFSLESEGDIDLSGMQEGLDASNAELDSLIEEQTTVQEDLDEQNQIYDSTSSEAESVLSDMDSEIDSTNCDLDSANNDEAAAQSALCQAQSEAESANQQLSDATNCKDECYDKLSEATNNANDAQDVTNQANDANQAAIQDETVANNDLNDANNDLNNATNATNQQQVVQAGTQADLNVESAKTVTAFNTLNQEQSKVDKAQREYNNAKTDQSLWDKFKNWVSGLWNSLQSAIGLRDKAAADLERQQQEEDKARAVNEEAIEKLDERKEEQDKAQEVADAAQVVYEEKMGIREVTDQEYADALLDLADALLAQDNAENKYDSALTMYLAANNYSVNANNEVVNAEGEVVDCQQIVADLEVMVQGLVNNRTETETSYNDTLTAVAGAISGDEQQLETLGQQIEALRADIAQQEQEIAMQEQLLAEMQEQRALYEAQQGADGIFDDLGQLFTGNPDEKVLAENRALLEQALMSGDPADIQAAYVALYGDKVIGYNEDGSEIKLNDLSETQLNEYYESQKVAAGESYTTARDLFAGQYVLDGEPLTQEVLNDVLLEQAEALIADMEKAMKEQGWLSKAVGGVNDVLGLGTSESEAMAQLDYYKSLVEELQRCQDPAQYAAIYKAITGENFSLQSIGLALAYNENQEQIQALDSCTSRSDYLNALADIAGAPIDPAEFSELSDEELENFVRTYADNKTEAMSLVGNNTNASEAIQEYVQTQQAATDAVIGVIDGVVTAVAVAATPFTGGASLALGAAIGAGLNVGLNWSNSIYDSTGDGNWDFNYTWKDFGKDLALGALNGAVGVGANSVGASVTKVLGKKFGTEVVATTFGKSVANYAANFGAKVIGAGVEGMVDGGLSSAGSYLIDVAAGDREFSGKEFIQTVSIGTAMGGVFNAGMTGATTIVGDVIGGVQAHNLTKQINNVLDGGDTDNAIARMIAGKLDDGLMDGAHINQYATKQLMDNANSALSALKRAGLDTNAAMEILNNTTLEAQKSLSDVVDVIARNFNGIDDVDLVLPGGKNGKAALLQNLDLDSIKLDDAGNLLSARSVLPDGTEINLEFKPNGKLATSSFTRMNGTEDAIADLTPTLDKYNELISAGLIDNNHILDRDNIANEGSIIQRNKVNTLVSQDIDTLYEAYKQGIDITDNKQLAEVFIKNFDTEDAAIESLKVGDLCRIGDADKISIKMADGSIHKLDISAEKYMELFPPIERYGFRQQQIGDCYLVSTLDALNKNPETRAALLDCFKTTDEGIAIQFKNGSAVFTLEDGKTVSDYMADSFTNTRGKTPKINSAGAEQFVVDGTQGMQALEYAYGYNLMQNTAQGFKSQIDDATSRIANYTEKQNILNQYINAQNIDLDAFREDMARYASLGGLDTADDLYNRFVVNLADGTQTVDAFKLRQEIAGFDTMINIEGNNLARAQSQLAALDELVTPQNMRGNGGWMENVMKMFGFEDATRVKVADAGDLLTNPDNWEGKVFTAATIFEDGKTDEFFIDTNFKMAYGHAYSIRPTMIDGELIIKVNNPWNTADTIRLTYEQFKKFFSYVSYATV